MKIVLFGATGGIGTELQKLYKNDDLTAFGSRDVNFYDENFKNNLSGQDDIKKLLSEADLIINCAGRLGSNGEPYDKVFDVNFNPSWLFIKYFTENPPAKPKKFVMIGSMAYSHGRDDYMLYCASKAALYNLYLSSVKYFKNSDLIVGLVNLPAVKSKMTANMQGNFMTKQDCARRIYGFVQKLSKSDFKDLT